MASWPGDAADGLRAAVIDARPGRFRFRGADAARSGRLNETEIGPRMWQGGHALTSAREGTAASCARGLRADPRGGASRREQQEGEGGQIQGTLSPLRFSCPRLPAVPGVPVAVKGGEAANSNRFPESPIEIARIRPGPWPGASSASSANSRIEHSPTTLLPMGAGLARWLLLRRIGWKSRRASPALRGLRAAALDLGAMPPGEPS